MRKPILSLICSIAENRAIGKNNQLLWNIPEDLLYFKKITLGHVVIMGERTFRSIGKELPGRTNIIITRDLSFKVEGCIVCHSIKEALLEAKKIEKEEIFIIGGASVYEQTIKMADKLYLTIVEGNFDGDVFFPNYSEFSKVVFEKESSYKNYKYRFLQLEK